MSAEESDVIAHDQPAWRDRGRQRGSGSLLMRFAVTTALLTLAEFQGCSRSRSEAVVVEYRPATRGDARADCELREPIQHSSVVVPSGRRIDVRFTVQGAIAFNVQHSDRLIVRDITASNPAGTPSFEVVVFPEETEANRIKRSLRNRPECDWLVTVEGSVVQLAFPAERGDEGISGGLFPSLDSALAVYRRAREEAVVQVQSHEEGTRIRAFWAWREKMDAWEMACDPEFQQYFRENDPKNFEITRETFGQIDCSVKPLPPAESAGGTAD